MSVKMVVLLRSPTQSVAALVPPDSKGQTAPSWTLVKVSYPKTKKRMRNQNTRLGSQCGRLPTLRGLNDIVHVYAIFIF